MKLLAVVITYYPEKEEAVQNILRYVDHVDKLIIWENTPEAERAAYRLEMPEEYCDKVSYFRTGDNEGIAYPLNRVIEWGLDNGYTHLLTMDQDSHWLNFDLYRKQAEKYGSQYHIMSPDVNAQTVTFDDRIRVVHASITSGSIYDLTIFREVGLFREDFFIDAVDTELCYRAASKGYPTICICNAHLKQQYSAPIKVMGITSLNYTAFRTYHIVRNHIRLWRGYSETMEDRIKKYIRKKFIVKRFFKIILIEKSKRRKLGAMIKGLYHGFTYSRITNEYTPDRSNPKEVIIEECPVVK